MAFDAQHMFSVPSQLCKCILCTEKKKKKKKWLDGKLLAAAGVVATAVSFFFFLLSVSHRVDKLFADGRCQSCRQASSSRLSITWLASLTAGRGLQSCTFLGHQGSVHFAQLRESEVRFAGCENEISPASNPPPLALPSLAVFTLFLPPLRVLTRNSAQSFLGVLNCAGRVESQSSFCFV